MHAMHGEISDGGLADDCPACAQAAANPTVELDSLNLQGLVERTLSDRFGYEGTRGTDAARLHARTNVEAEAMAVVMKLLEKMGQLVDTAPAAVEWYLRTRWHTEITIGETAHDRALQALKDRLP